MPNSKTSRDKTPTVNAKDARLALIIRGSDPQAEAKTTSPLLSQSVEMPRGCAHDRLFRLFSQATQATGPRLHKHSG